MDLSTTYLGMELKNPLIAGASPLSQQVDSVRRLEDAGIAAVVAYSLFQEQIEHDAAEQDHYLEFGTESFAEALSHIPAGLEFPRGPEEYLEHLSALKQAVSIPVIGSLNGTSTGGWIEYAKNIEQAGADAIELNMYYVATNPDTSGEEIEQRHVDVVNAVKSAVKIPVAVKLSPYISAMAHFARRLEKAGADGLVLFNRFYQPDIDLDEFEVQPELVLSSPHEKRLPLRWIAVLDPLVRCSLAASSGIYTGADVVKMMLAGADATQLCAAILRDGPPVVGKILDEMASWMSEKEHESVKQMQGSMNLASCENTAAFERGNYMRMLREYSANV